MAKSIFKFADKFGYESPFGDWLKDTKSKILEVTITHNTKAEQARKTFKIPTPEGFIAVPLIITIKTDGMEQRVEMVYEGNTFLAIKRFFGHYESYIDALIPAPFYEKIITLKIATESDKKFVRYNVSTDAIIEQDLSKSSAELEEKIKLQKYLKVCGGEYQGKTVCKIYNGTYGPVYEGNQPFKLYKYFDKLIKEELLTEDEKDIIIAMSDNEGNLDSVQSYDSEILSAGAMQKTLNTDGTGEFPIQIWEFKEAYPKKYKLVFEEICKWKVFEDGLKIRMIYDNIEGKMLQQLIRKGFNKNSLRKKIESVPLLPIIKLLNDSDFQAKQLTDFIKRLKYAINNKPMGYKYEISMYVKSKLGKALVLDHDINRPAYVPGDFAAALNTFYEKNPDVSKNPNDWKINHKNYEAKLLEIYGPARRMTSKDIAKKRYSDLKKKLA